MAHREDRTLGLDDVAALGTVVGVWAHPDDEAYLAAGVMAGLVAAGRRVVSVSATLGEQGLPGLPVAEAGARRRDELVAALEVVGVTEHHVLGLSDGGCAEVDPRVPVGRIAALLAEVAPDTVLTFGPDGMTGHPDHRAVSAWTAAAVARAAPRARLLAATLTPEHARRSADVLAAFDVMIEGDPPQTPHADLDVHVELSGRALALKVAALRAHASQTGPLADALGAERYAAWVAEESFVRMRPVDGIAPEGGLTSH